jgi:hypothetical protein
MLRSDPDPDPTYVIRFLFDRVYDYSCKEHPTHYLHQNAWDVSLARAPSAYKI